MSDGIEAAQGIVARWVIGAVAQIALRVLNRVVVRWAYGA